MADLTSMMQAAAGVSTGNPNAWDISYAAYDATPNQGDVSKAFYTGITLNATAQESYPRGLYVKPDGTALYIAMSGKVWQYTLANAWSLVGATYASKSVLVNSQTSVPEALSFKEDGTKMYVIGQAPGSDDFIFQYSLSTAWDVSTATYDSVSVNLNAREDLIRGLFLKPDGTKMYIIGTDGDDVNEYSLSTAWNLSTLSFVQVFSVSAQEATPSGIAFLGDGLTMYISGTTGDDVNEYSLSVAWDISTASYVQNFSVSSQSLLPNDIFFKPDGTSFFILGEASTNSNVYQYNFGGFSVAAQETVPEDVFFKDDGTKMYIIGNTGDDVNEYDLSTAWDITTASYLQNKSIAAQETSPSSLFFKPDGLKMYVLGAAGVDVNEYDLSTPWDVSSASYVQNFSVASQEAAPRGLFFKPDGNKMYITGNGSDNVNEYDLSTSWDISTASYLQNFSVATEETVPQALSFKPDGMKMYVVGSTGDDVNEYDLSTPWDVSTASYVQNFSVLETTPTGIYWRDNGEEFFIVGSGLDRVQKYTISST